MNKSYFYALIVLITFSLTEAATRKPYYFNIYDELLGSWKVTKSITKISDHSIIEQDDVSMMNVTKNDVPRELLLAHVDYTTKEEIRKPYQRILSVPTNYSAVMTHFQPGTQNEIQKQLELNINEMLKGEVYSAFGTLTTDANKQFEFTILPNKLVLLEIIDSQQDERISFVAQKIIEAAPKSWFQKYGAWIIIAISILVQLFMASIN